MKFRISSEYGVLEHVREGKHTGIDLVMPEGTTLRSLVDGTIEAVFNESDGIGKGVKILSEDGKEFIYGHMRNVDVKVGDHVSVRDILGESGNTGNSTGPHLHFGVKDHGEFIDPSIYNQRLQHISGDIYEPGVLDWEGKINVFLDDKMMMLRENSGEMVYDFLEIAGDVLIELLGAITLVGTGVLIILKLAGYDKGYKYAGVLFTVNALVKYLFGGN